MPSVVSFSLSPSALESGARRSAVIARLSKLAPFQPAAVKLLTLSGDTATGLAEFERAFGSDPALAANLLALANSPLYGLETRIDNLRHAVMLLGFDTVRSLALTVAMSAYVRGTAAQRVAQVVWSHGIATGIIAEAIGRARGEAGSSLYAAGLVHDIGRLGMLNLEGERYAALLERDFYEVEESILLETLLFGCSHDDAGAFLARTWGFPESVSDCVHFHHQLVLDKGPTLRTVQIACHYAGALGFGELKCADQPPALVDALPPELRAIPQLEPARMRERILQAETEFSNLAAPKAPREVAVPVRKSR